MIKKVLAAALGLGLCAGLAFAGGGMGSAGGSPTLTWWFYGNSPNNLREALRVIGDYMEPRVGARLDIKVASWSDSQQRMRTIVNSGEYYDIMYIDMTDYNNFVGLGAYADLTEALRTDAPALQSFIPAMLWDGVRINGKIYSVPTYKDSSKTRFYIWDDTYVQKYKIDIGKAHSFAELDRAFRAIKAGEGARFYPLPLSQGNPFDSLYADDYDSMTAGLPPIGVGVNDPNRRVVSVFEQPEIMERLRYLHRWYVDGIVNPDAPVLQEPLKQRAFFHAIGWPAAVSVWQVNEGVRNYAVEKVFGPSYSTDSIQGSLNAINANSRYKTQALKLLELVNTDHKMRDMMAFGIEGVNFSYVKPNVVRLLTADQWNLARYQQGTFFQMSTIEGEPEDAWDQVRRQNEGAGASVLLGFVFNNRAVVNEIANCISVYDKYKYELLSGASDPAVAVPNMVRDLNAAGLRKIIDEAQRQIDAFKR
jgi:putative aldouronate transport system substrate-binding protein